MKSRLPQKTNNEILVKIISSDNRNHQYFFSYLLNKAFWNLISKYILEKKAQTFLRTKQIFFIEIYKKAISPLQFLDHLNWCFIRLQR